MDRPMSFEVKDYDPEEDEWISSLVPLKVSKSGPSSPIHQNPDTEDDMPLVTITLDINEYTVVVTNGCSSEEENPKPMLQKRNRPKKSVGYRRRRPIPDPFEAFKGLEVFISVWDAGWCAVEDRFDRLTAETGGLLIRSMFGECAGINSKEFSLELFDSLAKRLHLKEELIDKAQLFLFCREINDQRFDSRLQIFFDMADKDGDGTLTEDEVREVEKIKFIRLTASANNQSTTKKMTDEYAALIMDWIDPCDMGYITMKEIGHLLLHVETLKKLKSAKKSTTKWWKVRNMMSGLKLIALTKT